MLVVVDLPAMNPCCEALIRLYFSKCSTILSLIRLSITLPTTEVRDTGH